MVKIYFIDNQKLKPHEQTRKNYLVKLTRQIKNDGLIKKPILVDRQTKIILDGHHRSDAAKLLGWRRVPVRLVNYQSPKITVSSWRKNVTVTKVKVINAGLSGKLLLPKTSKHQKVK